MPSVGLAHIYAHEDLATFPTPIELHLIISTHWKYKIHRKKINRKHSAINHIPFWLPGENTSTAAFFSPFLFFSYSLEELIMCANSLISYPRVLSVPYTAKYVLYSGTIIMLCTRLDVKIRFWLELNIPKKYNFMPLWVIEAYWDYLEHLFKASKQQKIFVLGKARYGILMFRCVK